MIHEVQAWDIRQIEFSILQDQQRRGIRWIDPKAPVGEACGWSLSVSASGPNAESCELRAFRASPVADGGDLAVLTSLLNTFGVHFAAHSAQLLGPVTSVADAAATKTFTDHQRRAA